MFVCCRSLDPDDIHVDIDSYEDGDSQALRDTLQWEAASNPSPADSTSTNNSKPLVLFYVVTEAFHNPVAIKLLVSGLLT